MVVGRLLSFWNGPPFWGGHSLVFRGCKSAVHTNCRSYNGVDSNLSFRWTDAVAASHRSFGCKKPMALRDLFLERKHAASKWDKVVAGFQSLGTSLYIYSHFNLAELILILFRMEKQLLFVFFAIQFGPNIKNTIKKPLQFRCQFFSAIQFRGSFVWKHWNSQTFSPTKIPTRSRGRTLDLKENWLPEPWVSPGSIGWYFYSYPMTDPWDYRHEWLIFMVNVGKYTRPMDPSWVLNLASLR